MLTGVSKDMFNASGLLMSVQKLPEDWHRLVWLLYMGNLDKTIESDKDYTTGVRCYSGNSPKFNGMGSLVPSIVVLIYYCIFFPVDSNLRTPERWRWLD